MTKFVLVGGHPWKAPDAGRGFADEMLRGLSEPVRILLVPFARPKEAWDKALADDKEFFTKHFPGKDLDIRLADERGFLEQVKWASVVLLKGGKSEVLIDVLNRHAVWEKELPGKTLAGSSAGADAI